jgi:AraC-like DNA-binding protein
LNGIDRVEQARPPERQEFWRHPGLGDLSLLKARFTRHRYDLHTHPTYVVALVTDGCERLRVGRRQVVAPAGSLILVNPEECHDGEPGAEGGWAYRTLYPTTALMADLAAALGRARLPVFAHPVVEDAGTARAIAAAHRDAEAGGEPMAAEASMLLALRGLLLRHAEAEPGRRESIAGEGARRRVGAYADLAEAGLDGGAVTLAGLAAAVGVTRFQVVRDVRRVVGLTPGGFVRGLRLRRAARLIEAGLPLAEAAAGAGFADQSHLTRAFRAVHGVTPGAFRRAALGAATRR